MTMPVVGKSFHDYIEANTHISKHTTTQTGKFSYRFYPHFHPYVVELIKRLIEKSVGGLQAADTEYGTPVKLFNNITSLKLFDGKLLTLSSGELITLPDGTLIELYPDSRQVKLESVAGQIQ